MVDAPDDPPDPEVRLRRGPWWLMRHRLAERDRRAVRRRRTQAFVLLAVLAAALVVVLRCAE